MRTSLVLGLPLSFALVACGGRTDLDPVDLPPSVIETPTGGTAGVAGKGGSGGVGNNGGVAGTAGAAGSIGGTAGIGGAAGSIGGTNQGGFGGDIVAGSGGATCVGGLPLFEPCQTCANNACCGQSAACRNDPTCSSLVSCLISCGSNEPCSQKCVDAFPPNDLVLQLSDCLSGQCGPLCDLPSQGGAGGISGSGGVGGSPFGGSAGTGGGPFGGAAGATNCNYYEGSTPACSDCLNTACCVQGDTCFNSPDCTGLLDCFAQNCPDGDQACFQKCGTIHPQGLSLYNQILSCYTGTCGPVCNGGTGGAGGSEPFGGAGGVGGSPFGGAAGTGGSPFGGTGGSPFGGTGGVAGSSAGAGGSPFGGTGGVGGNPFGGIGGTGGVAGSSVGGSGGAPPIEGPCQSCIINSCQAEAQACINDPACFKCALGDPLAPGCPQNPRLQAALACGCLKSSCGASECQSECSILGYGGAGGGSGESNPFTCSDGIDNDGDSYVDCDDSNCCTVRSDCKTTAPASYCAKSGISPENTVPTCSDGIDNDGDKYVDCDDKDCCDVVSCASKPQTYCGKLQPAVCGDGVQGPGEQCDNGGNNADFPAFQLVIQGFPIEARPVLTPASGVDFYSYSSASSHTGYEEFKASKLMLHVDPFTGQLTLITHHGIDADSSGIQQPDAAVQMKIAGPTSMSVALADDAASEFKVQQPGFISGNWTFQQNSDGGVVAGLPFPGDWTVDVSASFQKGITKWQWIDGSGNFFGLPFNGSVTLIARGKDVHGTCRTDCTVAVCGDGRLDAGEQCDDGINNGNGFCSSACTLSTVLPD